MYEITQNKTRKNWLGCIRTSQAIYTFEKYGEALNFALNEQIRYFSHIIEGANPITRDAYTKYYTLKNWVKLAEKNPHHYTGLTSSKGVNLERLYFYYVNSSNLHRIRKH